MSIARHALDLAAKGAPNDAVALLRRGEAAGDPEAMLMIGLWQVEARHLHRDFVAARRQFAAAATRGHVGAARVLTAFLAAGRGGPRDWPGALALLARMAPRDPTAARQLDLIAAMDLNDAGDTRTAFARERLCDVPRVERLPGLFTAAECAFLADAGRARFHRATIFHEGERRFVEDPLRTSDGSVIGVIYEVPAIHALNRRLAAVSGTDVAQGEMLQLLRYRPGQEYRTHFDAFPGIANQREQTLLVYLSDDFDGGETVFPRAPLAFRGGIGDGLLFRNVREDGRPDPASLHAGTPVTRGEKLIASRWIRARPPENEEVGFGQHEMA